MRSKKINDNDKAIFISISIFAILYIIITHIEAFIIFLSIVIMILFIILIIYLIIKKRNEEKYNKENRKKIIENYLKNKYENKEPTKYNFTEENKKYKFNIKNYFEKKNTREKNKQKGDQYEYFIGKYFKEKGYKMYYQGINKGFYDGGIDLIAYKGKEVLLIQCKNWEKWKIDKELLNKFDKDCERYINANTNKLSNKQIEKIFVVSKNNITQEAKSKLLSSENNINLMHIPVKLE